MAQTTDNTLEKQTGPYLQKFERFETQTNQPAWLFPLRKAGMASFAEHGFPTLKDEDWRFTNVAPIASLPFQPVFEPDSAKVSREALEQLPFAKIPGLRLVFVNGHYAASLSTPAKLPSGVKAGSLAAMLASHGLFLEKHFARYA